MIGSLWQGIVRLVTWPFASRRVRQDLHERGQQVEAETSSLRERRNFMERELLAREARR
jgi:hypothetical protein